MASEDELAPTTTEGYKVGEKKTLAELQQLDQEDERFVAGVFGAFGVVSSLGIKGGATGPADDPRRVVPVSLAMEVEGREDVTLDISTPDAISKLKAQPIIVKEGITYRMKIAFKVQHDVVAGLKYLHVVKRMGVQVDKTEEMIGSYGPQAAPYVKKFLPDDAPKGMAFRGTYEVRSRFIDDDKQVHLDFTWFMSIKKDWE
ncbi:E set domain-containing protein [Gonapodya prolifera JEL478]|uniref:E set domain-containing protein n=1 Tax=Gonapodya prolifera (strain JEL478) TaxID=1344416 RepID=A0A139AGL2_GONPJ|nr:E set domain-containing protein [Gonapodya prolifera JEL478]|eukprot:KXS15890.1 E set domain-containing protein [Gonapodya prolifera JEL478]